MTNNSFLKGAQILTAANLTTKIMGFTYRIFIVRIIGTEGIGLYQMIFPLYTLALVITTAGIPIAVSKLVSQEIAKGNKYKAKQILKISTMLLTILGICSSIIFYRLSPWIAEHFFADVRAFWPFVATVPAIFLVAVSSSFRGYFQGIQDMAPQAWAQIAEQLIRMFFGLFLGKYFLKWGVEFAALGLSIAMVAGEFTGLIILLLMYRRRKISGTVQKVIDRRFWQQMGALSFPVTITRMLNSIVLSYQAVIIPQMLVKSGLNIREAMDQYGQFSGVAMALLGFPSVITVSLAISLLPAISEASAVGNRTLMQTRSHQALRLTVLAGLPCAILFYFLASDFTTILFASPESAVSLKFLALGALFLYLQQTTSGLLQGLGKMGTLLIHSLLGSAVNILLLILLTPAIGIKGVAIAYIFGFIIIASLNLIYIARFTGLLIEIPSLISSPFFAGIAMSIIVIILKTFLSQTFLGLIISCAAGALAFVIVLQKTGGLKKSDLRLIPLLSRFVR